MAVGIVPEGAPLSPVPAVDPRPQVAEGVAPLAAKTTEAEVIDDMARGAQRDAPDEARWTW